MEWIYSVKRQRQRKTFQALFEVADNYYHVKDYKSAKHGYEDFLEYCSVQENVTEQESGWIDAYTKLANSRLKMIEQIVDKGKKWEFGEFQIHV